MEKALKNKERKKRRLSSGKGSIKIRGARTIDFTYFQVITNNQRGQNLKIWIKVAHAF